MGLISTTPLKTAAAGGRDSQEAERVRAGTQSALQGTRGGAPRGGGGGGLEAGPGGASPPSQLRYQAAELSPASSSYRFRQGRYTEALSTLFHTPRMLALWNWSALLSPCPACQCSRLYSPACVGACQLVSSSHPMGSCEGEGA